MYTIHCHGGKSSASRGFADSSIKLEDLVKKAKEKGLKGMAITDHELVGSFIEAKNLEAELDFPVICGNEVYAVTDDQYDALRFNWEKGMYFPHFLLLALDEIGNRQLRELSTIAWIDNSFNGQGLIRTPIKFSDIYEVISKDRGHIVASSACLGGQIPKWITSYLENPELLNMRSEQIVEFIENCKGLFGDENFYLEIQPPKLELKYPETEIGPPEKLNPLQNLVNVELVKIAEETNTELVVTTDVHFLDAELLSLHCSFLSSGDDNDEDRDKNLENIYGTAYLMSEEEVKEHFREYDFDMDVLQRAIDNTDVIGDRAERYEMKMKQIVPRIEIEKEWELQENFFPDTGVFHEILTKGHEEDKYLLFRIQEGMKKYIQFIEYNETIIRLEEELSEILAISVILEENLGAYFISMEKIIDIIWKEGDSIVGVGRGSCASSIVAFLLGIIQVNPLKTGIDFPFWRFITRSRIELADIDIDTQSNRRNQVFNAVKDYFVSIGGDVVNCCTYGTVGSKSSIQTGCRGLGVSSDIAHNISSMIPVERGNNWSLKDSYYGNEEEDRKPVREFVKAVDSVEGLLDLALMIEGVIVSRGVHPSGVFITNTKFTDFNAKMLSPKGIVTSQYDLHESEQNGLLKYDFLTTKACSKIRLTMDMLIEANHIEEKESLRDTYNSILHPHIMNYNTTEVWETVANNRMMDLFQFSTPIAMQTVKEVKPTNVLEMTQSNSLMRLQQQDDAIESPTETFVKYKNDISLWYKEMDNYKVPKADQEMLAEVLLPYSGVAESQEAIMILTQLDKLSNFTVAESHKLRKAIAKKSEKVYKEITALFYEKCKETNVCDATQDYVWDVQVKRQKGYSFSLLHSYVYSLIALQELVLFTQYPEVYWNTACLTVNAGALDDDEGDTKKSTDYGAVASAIGKVQSQGTVVALPHINKAMFRFTPDEERNEIVFGLKGYVGIGDKEAHEIVNHRPYSSLEDFAKRLIETKEKVTLKTGKVQNKSLVGSTATISLIKGGSFDELEDKPRVEIMEDFLRYLYPPKKSMSIKGIDQVISMGIIPTRLEKIVKIYNFRKFITNKNRILPIETTAKSKKWHTTLCDSDDSTDYVVEFFNKHFMSSDLMQEGRDYDYDEYGDLIILIGGNAGFTKQYQEYINPMREWLNSSDCLDRYNKLKWDENWEQYASGSISKWEMDSLCFYYHEHELTEVDCKKYSIENFDDMIDTNELTSEEKDALPYSTYKTIKYPQFELSRIIGTVLEKDKSKHTATILTPSGVVLVKYYAGAFSHYDKQVSVSHDDGSPKTVLEKSWFTRGNLLMITGYRRGDQIKPKVYKGNAFQHTTSLIESVRLNGSLELKLERTKI